MSNAQDLLATRYGKRNGTSKRQRYAFTALAAILLVSFIVWAGYTSFVNSMAPQSQLHGFEIIDAQHSTATLEVTAAGAGEATCALQAQAENFSVVGFKEVHFDKVPTGRLTVTINTTELPVSVSIDRCW
ncbi:MAG: hypothetical protein RL118_839 [Actinomycetota bacterium]|jgi:hypothetical protein